MQHSELGRVAAIWNSRGDANAKACLGFAVPLSKLICETRPSSKCSSMFLMDLVEGSQCLMPPTFYLDAAAQIRMTGVVSRLRCRGRGRRLLPGSGHKSRSRRCRRADGRSRTLARHA
jgi:hypothetical protein